MSSIVKVKNQNKFDRYIITLSDGRVFYMDDFICTRALIGNDMMLSSDNIVLNKKYNDASMYRTVSECVTITGDIDAKIEGIGIGIGHGAFNPGIKYAVINDPLGTYLDYIRPKKNLPIGVFQADTDNNLINVWVKKGQACVFLPLCEKDIFPKSMCSGISTQLYHIGCTTSSIHFAISILNAKKIIINKCIDIYKEKFNGLIEFNNLYFKYEDELSVLSHITCIELCKNNGVEVIEINNGDG